MKFKKILAYISVLLICLSGLGTFTGYDTISNVVSAESYSEIEGLQYKVLDNGTIEISGYSGEEAEIVIPETIDGKKVSSIGNSAFWDCSGLTSITIPNSVTSIGDVAFYGCEGLTAIHGYENSYAQIYARENDIPFEVISSVPGTPDDKDAVTGDIDNNGVISTSDLLSLISYIIMNEDSINILTADMNKDGKVNVMDAIELKRILLK